LTVTEVYKAQELVYELKVGDIMTRRVLTVTPDMTMHQVKNLMRDNRISGLPVLVGEKLVGIVSIEDLIVTMERGELETSVSEHMTIGVYTIYDDESVIQALNKFTKTGVGRLPVVSRAGKLVGIITPDDITRGVLKALQVAYHEEEIRRYRASHLFEDIASDQTTLLLTYAVPPRDFNRAGRASSQLKLALGRLGVHPRIVRRVAIAAYEAEMNIVIHSTNGGHLCAEVTAERIVVQAIDQGPGIPDVAQALQAGYSTAPDWIREMGFGAGMGFTNIRNCVDEFALESSLDKGTRLEAVVYLHLGEVLPDEATSDR